MSASHPRVRRDQPLADIPRWTRRVVRETLGVSRAHIAYLCTHHCDRRKLLSDRDIEILRARKRKPGPKAKPRKP